MKRLKIQIFKTMKAAKKENGKRISLKLNAGNEWLADALEMERVKQSRPSINNTVQYILSKYFKT